MEATLLYMVFSKFYVGMEWRMSVGYTTVLLSSKFGQTLKQSHSISFNSAALQCTHEYVYIPFENVVVNDMCIRLCVHACVCAWVRVCVCVHNCDPVIDTIIGGIIT